MKLQTKVLLVLIPLVLASGVSILFFSMRAVRATLIQAAVGRGLIELNEISQQVSVGMRKKDERILLPILNALAGKLETFYVMALDPAGVVLAHTNVLEKGKTYSSPEINRILNNDEPTYREIEILGEAILDVSIPIWDQDDSFLMSQETHGKKRVGTLRLGVSLQQSMYTQSRIRGFISMILLATGVVLLAAILWFLRNILTPIRTLRAASIRIGRGEYGVTVPIDTKDELGDLALSFNQMSEGLAVTTVSKESLQKVVSLLNATLDSTTDGILVVDDKGKVAQLNQKFAQMWRIPDSLASTKDDNNLLGYVSEQLKDPVQFLAKIRELYADPSAESFDLVEFKDGRVFERYSRPQRLEGKVVGRVWSFRDVTERKRLETMLVQSEKLSAVGQLAAGVAHEINNPLGIILGFAQSAKKRLQGLEALALPINSIEREAMRCRNLVQNLLTFSRQNKPIMEKFDLNEAVMSTLSIIEAQARVKGVEVVKELAAMPPLMGDKNQLQQVIVNLCNNAIDAMPNGGRIVVRTRVRGADGDRKTVVEVEDNGDGIPKEIQSQIFDPFFTTKEVGKGTGLGLSLVYEIIQRHKGVIELKSEVGVGTTFTVFLPS